VLIFVKDFMVRNSTLARWENSVHIYHLTNVACLECSCITQMHVALCGGCSSLNCSSVAVSGWNFVMVSTMSLSPACVQYEYVSKCEPWLCLEIFNL